jgi:hypothetical protein
MKLSLADAVQAQLFGADTLTLPTPPEAGKDWDLEEIEVAQPAPS